jgi:hypothetical protein
VRNRIPPADRLTGMDLSGHPCTGEDHFRACPVEGCPGGHSFRQNGNLIHFASNCSLVSGLQL